MTESDKELNFRKLEESRDAALDQVTKLKSSLSRAVAQLAGFDPDKKVTQMVINEYLNSDDLELDSIKADDFASFATDAGLEPANVTTDESEEESTSDQPVTETEETISTLQERADELEGNLSTKEPETLTEKQFDAQREGDVRGSIMAGLQMMDQLQS